MNNKMNPVVKAKWLARLRAPDAKQCQGVLHGDDGFCCLGVLTDIYIQEAKPVEGWRQRDNHFPSTYNQLYQFQTETYALPWNVREWAGLTGPALAKPASKRDFTAKLAQLNDDGMSFADIALVIEEEV